MRSNQVPYPVVKSKRKKIKRADIVLKDKLMNSRSPKKYY